MSEKPSKPKFRFNFKLRISYLLSAVTSVMAVFLCYVGAMPFPVLVLVLFALVISTGKIENG